MECAGLTISLVEPPLPRRLPMGEGCLVAVVTLGCGCPVTAGGRWDSRRFRVEGEMDGPSGRFALRFSPMEGRPSEFAAVVHLTSPGSHALRIEALDPETGRIGRLWEQIEVVR